jgi:hypothetical protein
VHVPATHVDATPTVDALMHVGAAHCEPAGHVVHAPAPLQVAPSSPHVATSCDEHVPFGSGAPAFTGPHTPSAPCPFLAALQAMQAPAQAVLQQTPSAQVSPPAQSDVAPHFFPWAQPAEHWDVAVEPPPQSTSVSLPSFAPSLQLRLPPQPSGTAPHVAGGASVAQLLAVHPHTSGVPPPPHVCGSVQSALFWQPHAPCASQTSGDCAVPPHVCPAWMVFEGAPAEHDPVMQTVPVTGMSVSFSTDFVPPAPSQVRVWQSPATCCGLDVVAVPAAVNAVVHTPLAQCGLLQSVDVPGHSASVLHWSQLPAPSQYPA